jgi:hypothetical protein
MDTLHFAPRDFDGRGEMRPSDTGYRIDEPNLSDVEVFMLRGRRLQAQAVGGGLRRGLAALRRLLRGRHRGSDAHGSAPGHRHA